MPRIISGIAGGMRLKTPSGLKTRPTSDKAKEAMFSALGSRMDVDGVRVLDLFSGSGGLGIEALSRGADSCVFIDKSSASVKCINENLKFSGLNKNARVIRGDFASVLKKYCGKADKFDLVLMDPPYIEGRKRLKEVSDILKDMDLLSANAFLVAEISSADSEKIPELEGFDLLKACSSGSAMVLFYKYS